MVRYKLAFLPARPHLSPIQATLMWFLACKSPSTLDEIVLGINVTSGIGKIQRGLDALICLGIVEQLTC
jgi:hypothetical protein